MLAKALFFDDVRNGKTAFKAILIMGLHRADKENAGRWEKTPNGIGGALCRHVRLLARSMLARASCSIVLCVGDGVTCVGH